jgi:CheY-like chemotaxis protein
MPLQRILVVDDEENVALTLQAGLESLPDCEVAVATSGEQALRLFRQQPFDLLITDYRMPDIDGLALAAQVRELHPQVAIIMVTAYGSDALQQDAARSAILHVLDKPVGIAEIRQAARQALYQVGSGHRDPRRREGETQR